MPACQSAFGRKLQARLGMTSPSGGEGASLRTVRLDEDTAARLQDHVGLAAQKWASGEREVGRELLQGLCHEVDRYQASKGSPRGSSSAPALPAEKELWCALAFYGLGRMQFAGKKFEAAAETLMRATQFDSLDTQRKCSAWILAATAHANRVCLMESTPRVQLEWAVA